MTRGRRRSRGGDRTTATRRNTRSSDLNNSEILEPNPDPQLFSGARFQTTFASVIRDALPEIIVEVLNCNTLIFFFFLLSYDSNIYIYIYIYIYNS
jgi:hypothetical protein